MLHVTVFLAYALRLDQSISHSQCSDRSIRSRCSGSVESLSERFAHAVETLDCDVILSTGGVSMGGEVDLVKHVLSERLGGVMHFGQLFMKPGKPTAFYTLQRSTAFTERSTRYVFALPGNPVSAIVTCLLLVLPALCALAGAREPAFRRIPVRVSSTPNI